MQTCTAREILALTALVVLFGVEKGIEKVSKLVMPLLVALSIFIAVLLAAWPQGAFEKSA